MKETLHRSNGLDETRVRRAFRWVVTFRDFPAGSYQTVDGDSMMSEALTLFTKGRAEFYLDGVKRGDRIPGILSSEHDPVGLGGTFEIRYLVPTTRVCIPAVINNGKLPSVAKIMLSAGDTFEAKANQKLLICLGSIDVQGVTFREESSVQISSETKIIRALETTILLDFTKA